MRHKRDYCENYLSRRDSSKGPKVTVLIDAEELVQSDGTANQEND